MSSAVWATCGAATLHGPHHAAQKSTSTGTLLSRTISSNSLGVTSMGLAIAGSGALHAPHLPASERCFAGIRFGFPQAPQFLTIANCNLPFLRCRDSRYGAELRAPLCQALSFARLSHVDRFHTQKTPAEVCTQSECHKTRLAPCKRRLEAKTTRIYRFARLPNQLTQII